MRRNLVAMGLIGFVVTLAACGKGGELPKLPGAASASATGERAMAADSAGTSMMVANIRYELADGLSTDEKTGKAYQFDDATEADVTRLAKAFGVEGDVQKDGESWSVGASQKDAEVRADGAYLYVSRNGGVFSMSVNSTMTGSGSSGCAEPVAPDAPVASDQDVAKCETPVTTTTIPKDAPTAESAKKAAADALNAAGVDIDGAKVSVESFDNAIQNVRYQHTVDGFPVAGYETYVAVGPKDKIVSASGYLVDPSSVGTYELASLQRAVERLNESFGGEMRTLEARDDATATAGAPAPGEPQVDPAPGEPLVDPPVSEEPNQSTEPTVVTLTKVSVALMLQSDFDGDLWLVPAYNFASADGNEVTAQAAADKYIEQPPTNDTPAPSDGGSGGGTEPGGGSPGSDPQCAPITGELSGEVCASATSVKAGEPVSFRITAADSDRGFSSGPCFDGVTADYGDAAYRDVRCEACSVDVPAGPGEMSVERSHTYDKPGTYTAIFTIKSGADCAADPKDSEAKVALTIKVA